MLRVFYDYWWNVARACLQVRRVVFRGGVLSAVAILFVCPRAALRRCAPSCSRAELHVGAMYVRCVVDRRAFGVRRRVQVCVCLTRICLIAYQQRAPHSACRLLVTARLVVKHVVDRVHFCLSSRIVLFISFFLFFV